MKLRPYQEEAVTFIFERNRSMVLAQEGIKILDDALKAKRAGPAKAALAVTR